MNYERHAASAFLSQTALKKLASRWGDIHESTERPSWNKLKVSANNQHHLPGN
jgi:hypothetical protein